MMGSREEGRWEVGKKMGSVEEDEEGRGKKVESWDDGTQGRRWEVGKKMGRGKREEGRVVGYLTRPGPKARRIRSRLHVSGKVSRQVLNTPSRPERTNAFGHKIMQC